MHSAGGRCGSSTRRRSSGRSTGWTVPLAASTRTRWWLVSDDGTGVFETPDVYDDREVAPGVLAGPKGRPGPPIGSWTPHVSPTEDASLFREQAESGRDRRGRFSQAGVEECSVGAHERDLQEVRGRCPASVVESQSMGVPEAGG